MLVESGWVRDTKPGKAVIEIQRSSACKSCGARGMCLTFGPTERHVEVRDPVGVEVGDRVEIGIKPAKVVWASTVTYIIPVVCMLAGGLLGFSIAPEQSQDEYSAGFSFGSLALCFFGIWLYDKMYGSRVDRLPVVVRVVEAE